MAQDPFQRPLISAQHGEVYALQRADQNPGLRGMVGRAQEAAAQHRRQRQRNEPRHQDGEADDDRELVEDAPDDAAHEEHRDEHRDQRDRHRYDREGDLARALERGLHRGETRLTVTDDVLQHDDRVVDHEADRERERHQRNVVEAVPRDVHRRKGPDDGNREGERGNDRRRESADEQKDDEHHQDDGKHQRVLHVGHGGLNGHRKIVAHRDVDRARKLRANRGQQGLDAVRDVDGVRIRLSKHRDRQRPGAVEPVRPLVAQNAVDDLRDLAEAHRGSVAIGNDQRAVRGSFGKFGVRLQCRRLLWSAERTDRHVRAGGGERALNFIEPDAADRQQVGIDLDADGKFLRAVSEDLRHPGQRRYALPDVDLDVVVYDGKRHRRGFQRHQQNRRIARVDLAIRGRNCHFGRQLARGTRDRRLDVLRRGIDIAIEVELHGDPADAEPAHRRDRVDAGDRRELAFERRGDRGGHGGRARARHVDGYRDGRKVDLRQRRHRQLGVPDRPDQHDRQGQRGGHHRAMDAKLGEVHLALRDRNGR